MNEYNEEILTNVVWLGRKKKEETDVGDKFDLEHWNVAMEMIKKG